MKDWQFCMILGTIYCAQNATTLQVAIFGSVFLLMAVVGWIIDKLTKE